MRETGRRTNLAAPTAALLLLALCLLCNAGEARAQWTSGGGNTTTQDNVGVGTNAPAYKLDIKAPDIRFGNYTNDAGVTRADSVSNILYIARSFGSDQYTAIGPGYSHKAMITTRETGQWVSDIGAMLMLRSSYTTLGNANYPYAWAGGNVELYYKRPGAMVAPYTSPTKFYDDTTTLPAYTNFKPELGFILNSAGNVGIGTASPQAALDVVGSGNTAIFRRGTNSLIFDAMWGGVGSGGPAVITTSGAFTQISLKNDGNVGIGTITPGYKLDVAGAVRSSSGGFVFPDGSVQTTAAAGGGSQWSAASGVTGIQYGGGNVGIGTPSPVASLDIGGNPQNAIRTSYLNVSASNAGALDRPHIRGTNTHLVVNGYGINTGGTLYLNYPGDLAAGQTAGTRIQESLFISATGNGGGGNVGIGTASPGAKLEVNGGSNTAVAIKATGGIDATGTITGDNIVAKFQDVAEWVPSVQKLSAGTVVVLDAGRTNHVVASSSAYDTKVAGVVSEQPGVILGVGGEGKVKVATTGRVKVRVDATRGAIKVGDLLVTGEGEGVAMRSVPVDLGGTHIHRPGTIIGKALEPLGSGVGEILVLLSLQ